MTFDIEKAYPDAIGRRWYVACKATIEGMTVLNVVYRRMGMPMIYGIGVVEDDSHATVLHADGFTTIYDEKENEENDMTEELKPCPMCGNSAKIMTEDCKWTIAYYVECTSSLCRLRTSGWGQKITAINNWNKRVKE